MPGLHTTVYARQREDPCINASYEVWLLDRAHECRLLKDALGLCLSRLTPLESIAGNPRKWLLDEEIIRFNFRKIRVVWVCFLFETGTL